MRYLIVVEGISDKGVVQEIAHRLGIRIEVLVMRGNNPNKASRIVKAKLVVKSYDKIIVLKDLHRYSEHTLQNLLNEILSKIDHPHKYAIIVRKAIEAWILAGMGVINAETIDDPAMYLDQIMKRRAKNYVKSLTLAKILAESIDLNKAMSNASSLRQFIEALQDP